MREGKKFFLCKSFLSFCLFCFLSFIFPFSFPLSYIKRKPTGINVPLVGQVEIKGETALTILGK